jgi:hypothetical protein
VNADPTHTGSCLCGGIRFTIRGPLAPIQICHCSQCRKAQGGPLATNIPVSTAALEWQDTEGLMQSYTSSPGKERTFCRRCGSPLFSRRSAAPELVRIRAGLLDEPVHSRPAFHQHAQSQPAWWPIDDDLPQHTAGYQGPPLG